MKVYLAGPITGLSYGEATDWRELFCIEGIEPLSPMRAKSYLSQYETIPDSVNTPLSSPRGIVARDHWDVRRCDLVFANLLGATRISIGTMIELGWASAYGKPIVLVMESNNIHQHAMVNELTGFPCSTLEEGICILKSLL
jgi:nucleoside 2-deoxyribosyltransferase